MDFVAVTEQMTREQQDAFVWFLDVVTLKRPSDPFAPGEKSVRDRRMDSVEYLLMGRLISGEQLEQQDIWVLEAVCATRMAEASEGSRLHDKAVMMVVLIGALQWMAQGMDWDEATEMSELNFRVRLDRLREPSIAAFDDETDDLQSEFGGVAGG